MNNHLDHDIYIFICGNKRTTGVCCGSYEHDNDFDNLKEKLQQYKPLLNHRVKLNKTGCLGRCANGPNLVIFPDNIWHKYQTYDELEKIVTDLIFD